MLNGPVCSAGSIESSMGAQNYVDVSGNDLMFPRFGQQATEICDPVRDAMLEFHQLLVAASPCVFHQLCASVTSA